MAIQRRYNLVHLVAQMLLWSLAWVSLPVLATPGAAYGGEFTRLQHDPGPSLEHGPAAAADNAGSSLSDADMRRLELQLEETEQGDGPYASGLAEPLESLARHYRDQGNLDAANALYQRALHVVRINDGLYGASQQPLVRSLLELARSRGDLEQLDGLYGYFFRLYGSGQPPYTGLRLDAALEYMRWQRQAINLNLDGGSERRLLQLYELNDNMLQATITAPEPNPRQYWQLVQSQLRNLYLLSENWQLPEESFGMSRNLRPYATPAQELDSHQQRLGLLQRSAGNTVTTLLTDYQAMLAESDYRHRAQAELALGDWYQWQESWGRATSHYQTAIRQLQLAGDKQRLQRWFGQPTELPANGAFRNTVVRDEVDVVQLEATFEVSDQGRCKSVTVSEDGDSGGNARRLRRLLLDTRFRPRFEDGEAVSSGLLTRTYRLEQ